MTFKIRKIFDKFNPLSSTIDNFIKLSVRPEEEEITMQDEQGQPQPVTDLEYLEKNYPENVNQPLVDNSDVSVSEILSQFASIFGETIVSVNKVKPLISKLINKLKVKNGITWNNLDSNTRKIFEISFNLDTKSRSFKEIELFPFDREERDLMDEIGSVVFSSINSNLENEELKKYELSVYEFGDVQGYSVAQKLLLSIFIKKLVENFYEILGENYSIYFQNVKSIREIENKVDKIQDLDLKNKLKEILNKINSKKTEMLNYIEDYGSDILGFDIEILDGLSIDFNKPGLLSRGELDRMVFSLESVLNTSAQMAGVAPSEDPYRSERFYDKGNESPAAGQEERYENEKMTQLKWTNLIENFPLNKDFSKEVDFFLSNYGLSVENILEIQLPDFDSKNPKPLSSEGLFYENWTRRKFIAFVKASKEYASSAGAKIYGGEFDIFPENVWDAMIAIGSGVNQTNSQGIGNISFKFENPYKQFPGLSKFVQSFMGKLEDVYFRFKINPTKDYSSNAERIRIKEASYLLEELNSTANRINSSISNPTEESNYTLPRDIIFIRDGSQKFFEYYDKLIGIKSNMSFGEKEKKYTEVSSPISANDLLKFNSSISSYDGGVVLSLLNKVNDSCEKIVKILGSLKHRTTRKQEKELIIRLKEASVNIKKHIKGMGNNKEDFDQLKNYVSIFKSYLQQASGPIRMMYGESDNTSKLINSIKLVAILLDREIGFGKITENSKEISERLTTIINILKEASDERLGISESAINSEDEIEFKRIQSEISRSYLDLLNISLSDEENKFSEIKEVGDKISKLSKESLPVLENMLNDFWNLDSNDNLANTCYKEIQSASEDLPEIFFAYGDYKILMAEEEAEIEKESQESESEVEKKEKKIKIKTEYSFDEDNQTITFNDIKKSKNGIERKSRSYDIGDPRLERALKTRKLIKLSPEENSGFMRAFYEDTYFDPSDIKKESDFEAKVIYNTPQNPSVLNRIIKDLQQQFHSGEINDPKELKLNLKKTLEKYNKDEVFGKQIKGFISGLLNSNQETETISKDLFRSLIIIDIENNFKQNSKMFGNPFLGGESLDKAIDKAIDIGEKNPKYKNHVEVLKEMKTTPLIKTKLIDYHLKGTLFSTDIRKERKRENLYTKLISIFPEVENLIGIAIQESSEDFIYNPEFIKLTTDVINAKKEEKNLLNTPALLENAKTTTKQALDILIDYMNKIPDEGETPIGDVSYEQLAEEEYYGNEDRDSSEEEIEDEESLSEENYGKQLFYDKDTFEKDYYSFISKISKKLLKERTFNQYFKNKNSEAINFFIESFASQIDEDFLSKLKEQDGYSIERLIDDVLDSYGNKNKKSSFNTLTMKKISSSNKIVFNLKENRIKK